MPKEFDATLKTLLEESPTDWPVLLGYGQKPVEVIDADISVVSGAADKVLRVQGTPPWILHIDFQTGPDASVPCRINMYNAILEQRHGLLVRSAVVLLRPEANLRAVGGLYQCQFEEEAEPYRMFRYQVVRVWQLPPRSLLAGGLGLLPLAPISAVTDRELPGVLRRMKERLGNVRPRSKADQLWTAAYILMGLRFERSLIKQLIREVRGMKESVTYQAIIEEGEQLGRLKEARRMLLLQGQHRYKVPASRIAKAAVEAIDDIEQLEQLGVRMLEVKSWEELLQLPSRPSQRKKSSS